MPDGSASPNSSGAIASPSTWPGYQFSTTPATFDSHGITIGPPLCTTTIVCGFAFATAETSAFSSDVVVGAPAEQRARAAVRNEVGTVGALGLDIVDEHDGYVRGTRCGGRGLGVRAGV